MPTLRTITGYYKYQANGGIGKKADSSVITAVKVILQNTLLDKKSNRAVILQTIRIEARV
jgi:hypothetical protein